MDTPGDGNPNKTPVKQSAAPNLNPPLAYENKTFIESPDGRILRILAEFEEPLARFRRQQIQDTVVFFGSARYPDREKALAALASLEQESQANPAIGSQTEFHARLHSAQAALEMSRYYEDARQLAHRLTTWSSQIQSRRHRFVITTGGGPGIMEAANRGAHDAGGLTIGLNIRLPHEQRPNPYITPELCFNFHYFFMRKYWFAYLSKALVAFPGGFGTLDEFFEILTLAQTHKLAKKILIVLYGREYWNGVINFEKLVDSGSISATDLELFRFADTPDEAYTHLHDGLIKYHSAGESRGETPEIAKTLP